MSTDLELVSRHLTGDRAALPQLLERHEGPLLRFARTLVRSEDLAQDAVQEAFLRLLREGRDLASVRSLENWLFQVTRNLCTDLQRKEARMNRRHAEAGRATSGSAMESADTPAVAGETRERVREAVSRLPDPQREVVRLKLWEGLTYREIGERLGMPSSNVSFHLGQAVRTLAGQLRSVGILG